MNALEIPIRPGFYMTRLTPGDADSLVEYLNDETIYQNTLTVPFPYRKKDADIFLKAAVKFESLQHKVKDLAIRNTEGKQVGGIGLLYNHGLDSHRSEIGYWIAAPFRNMGIMTQAITAFCEWVWETTDLVRLEAQVFKGNKASAKVLEKAGFNLEGEHRAAVKKGNSFKDVMLFAIFRPGLA